MRPPGSVVLTIATRRMPKDEVRFGQSLNFIGSLPKVTASPNTCLQHFVALSHFQTPLPPAAVYSFK
jgi:hypothetical protein